MTTVTGRICLDRLAAGDPAEQAFDEQTLIEQTLDERRLDERTHPEANALVAESVGSALLMVLERLTPAERIAFVLHDVFDLPFDEIAGIVGRSTGATKMLAADPDRVRALDVADLLRVGRGHTRG